MTADTGRVSFGIKTSQAGTTYDQILRTWREAEAVPEFEHAWLWDHLVPLRGEVTGPALEAAAATRPRSPAPPSSYPPPRSRPRAAHRGSPDPPGRASCSPA